MVLADVVPLGGPALPPAHRAGSEARLPFNSRQAHALLLRQPHNLIEKPLHPSSFPCCQYCFDMTIVKDNSHNLC